MRNKLCLILILVLIIGVFTGCSQKNSEVSFDINQNIHSGVIDISIEKIQFCDSNTKCIVTMCVKNNEVVRHTFEIYNVMINGAYDYIEAGQSVTVADGREKNYTYNFNVNNISKNDIIKTISFDIVCPQNFLEILSTTIHVEIQNNGLEVPTITIAEAQYE